MSVDVTNLKEKVGNRLSGFSGLVRVAILAGAVVVLAIILFWLFNEVFYYLLAKSYADELSQAYNLNKGFTKALVWASFAAVVVFAGWTFSFSKRKRTIGYIGILALLIGHGLLTGRRDPNYDTSGKTEKCYVLKRDGITILNHVGIDPDTGRECKLLTPQMAEKYNAYKDGKRPQVVTDVNPAFFDPVSGEPIIWFAKDSAGRIELFDLMGFHPQTGEELKPVDKEVVDEWRKQSSQVVRRVPNRIPDPNTYGFFDPLTGSPKVWFWASEAGEYEFFDGPGFHPTSGDALKPVSRDAISRWKQAVQAADDKARKEHERQEHEARDQFTAKKFADQRANEEAQQPGPSFDCLKASYADEHAICDNTELSQLDRSVVAAFASVRRLHGDQYAKAIAAPLLQSRHTCNSDVGCIKRLQLASIKEFQANGAQLSEAKCRVMDPTGTPLNVRASPSGQIIGSLPNDLLVAVIDRAVDQTGKSWVYISKGFDGEPIGWVYRQYVSCVD